MPDSVFNYFSVSTLSPYVRIYRSFDIFWTIGTVLGPMYFSTAVASAGCFFFFFFFLVVTRRPVLKFVLIIFFSLLPESMIGIYAWLSLRKQHQTPRYFLSLFWHSLSSDSLQPVFEEWDRVRSLISTKLCVWFPRLLPTLGFVWIWDIWSYPLTIRLVLSRRSFYWRPRQTLNIYHCPLLLSWDISIFCGIVTFWS